MLSTICPRVARALVAGRRHSRRVSAFGTFRQRTIDRRYCGLPFIGGPAQVWYPTKCRLAGGVPSALVWVPFSTPAVRQSGSTCHFCQGLIEPATSRCACYA